MADAPNNNKPAHRLCREFNDHASKVKCLYSHRIKQDKVYGIPVRVITASQIEREAGPGIDRAELWKRKYKDLPRREKMTFIRAAQFYYDNDTAYRRALNPGGGPWGAEWAKNRFNTFSYYMNNAINGDGTMSANDLSLGRLPTRAPTNAWEAGPNRYVEARKGVLLLNDTMPPQQMLARVALHTDPDNIKDFGIAQDDMNLMSLEHELAHLSGADEPQADAMGAAQYIRGTGSIKLPRIYADMRALGALRNAASDYRLQQARENGTLDRDYPQYVGKERYIDAYLKQENPYLWGTVDALDDLIAKGAKQVGHLTDEEIHAMRFKKWDQKKDALSAIAAKALHMARKDGKTGDELDDAAVLADYLPAIEKTATAAEAPIVKRLLRARENMMWTHDENHPILLAGPRMG